MSDDEAKKLDHKIDYLELIENKGAEIERLKTVIESQNRSIDRHLALITELCDAMESYHPTAQYHDLLRRAREATR